jgi:translation initiation factor 2B subunit (eIF-2B alpha/beta/delta family)
VSGHDFAEDRESGATGVAAQFLSGLERWAAMDRSRDGDAFRLALLAHLREAQAVQPTMALVHQLAARALSVTHAGLQRGEGPADLRAHVAQSALAEREDLNIARASVAATAASLVTESDAWIATLSSSDTVRDAFLAAHRAGRRPRALLAEGRPRLEGRRLARTLAEAGIPVWLVVDAALPLLAGQVSMVWLGADAVTERGPINKIGSWTLALAARERSVPVYALASRRKFLPASTAALRILEMPPEEVWREPAPGVQPRNVYFELVPIELLRGVVVEDEVLGSSEVGVAARDRELPQELNAATS